MADKESRQEALERCYSEAQTTLDKMMDKGIAVSEVVNTVQGELSACAAGSKPGTQKQR